MKNKIISIVLLLGIVLTMLAGCNNDNIGDNNDNGTNQGDEEKAVVGNKIGNECPSYALDLALGGGKVSVKDLRGKVVVINFWGTWCSPCMMELPDFDRIASEYSDEVAVLAIHSVQGKINAPEYIETNFGESEIIFAFDQPLSGSVDMYYNLLGGGSGYPKTMILNEKGIITFSHTGMLSYEQLKAEIDAILDAE